MAYANPDDLWHETLDIHLRGEFGLEPTKTDPALYIKVRDDQLVGLNANYVDDLLRAGKSEIRQHCRETHSKFGMPEEEDLPCNFAGFTISGDKVNGFSMDQNQYLKDVEHLPVSASFPAFRSMRMKLGWLGNSLADCAIEISQLAQVPDVIFRDHYREIVKRINRVLTYAVDNPVALQVPKLDLETLQVIGFSNASFANVYDLTSQLEHIVYVTDGRGNAAPIHF